MQDKSTLLHQTHPLPTPPSFTTLQQTPISSLKLPFTQWIRCLPMEQRFLAVKIHVPQAAQTVKRIFCREEPHIKQHSSQQRSQNGPEARKFSRKYEKNFFDSLVFVSDGHQFLDHICFDFAFLECPQKLFEVLVACGGQLLNSTLGSLMKRPRQWKGFNQNLYKLDREQMSYQLFLYLRQQIFVNFNESNNCGDFLTKSLEEEKKRKKEFSNHWKFSTEESKNRLLLLGHEDIDELCKWLADQGIYIKTFELDKEIEEMLKLEKNQFCNRIFKCKLKKVLSPILGYYELVYMSWKKEIEKARKKRVMKYNRSQRDYNSQQKTEYIKEGKQYNKQQYKESNKQYKESGKRKNKKNRKSNSLQSNQTNQTNQTEHSIGKKIEENKNQEFDEGSVSNTKNILIKQQTKLQSNPESPIQQAYTKKSQSTNSNASTELSSKKSQQDNQQKEAERLHIRRLNIIRLSDELQQISDKISQQANQFHDRRVIAFQRIQFLLEYYNVPIKLFGSCASGIAVRNSDIDIAIDNSILMYMDFLPQNQRIRAALQKLQELFITQVWITQIKFIKTAAIPLIKLTVNTQLPFFDPSIGPMYYELNRHHNCGPINADITVETKNKSEQCSHLGLISTNAINKWLSEISCLHSIIIILKEMFGRRKLNCTYEGGLNTFSMIVLVVAYIYHAKLENQENAAEVFEKVLRFYSQEFDQRERGVDLLNRESNNIFYIKNLVNIENSPIANKQKADLQIKDPMNQQKNMTRNCYSFPQIKKLFQLMTEHCFIRGEKQTSLLLQSNYQQKEGQQQWSKAVFGSRNVFIEFLNSMQHIF